MVTNKLSGALTHDKYFVVNIEKRELIPIMVEKITNGWDYAQFKKFDDILIVNGYVDLKGINGRRILEIENIRRVWDEVEGREVVVEEEQVKGAWTELEEKTLIDSLIKIPIGTKERYAKVTVQVNLVNGAKKRTEKEIIKKVKEQELIKQIGVQKYNELKAQANGISAAAAAPTPEPVAVQAPVATAVVWSAEEQKLLESGLKSVGKDDGERWAKIATIVKTKDAAQCEARFTWIREQLAAKKAAAGK